jgi:protein SCO1/2
MSHFKKAGFLLFTLVVPALVFLFLRYFGQNHYTLPRYIPLIDSLTGEPLTRLVNVKGKQVRDTIFHTLPDFSLTDQEGKLANLSRVKGKIHVANFIFTRCPGQCPRMSAEMRRVQEAFEQEPSFLILSYTVDPEYDTPAVLKVYAQSLGAIPGKWNFLTGPKAEIYRMALKGYYVTAKEDKTSSQNLEDRFVHTDKLILVDPQGHIRGFYNGTDKKEVDRLILEAKVLLHELHTAHSLSLRNP